MNRILAVLIVGTLGAWTAAAQSSASAQAGASTQSQTSVQAGKSGAQASGSGSVSGSTSARASKPGAQASGNGSASGATSAQAGKSSLNLSNGTKIDATLSKPLDARKNKVGDPVEARTAEDVKQNGKVVLKRGTRLMGHVTQAQVRTTEQSQSQLGIVFDHALLRNGQEIPLNATVQALAAAQNMAAASAGPDDLAASQGAMGMGSGSARGTGGMLGGVTSTAGAATGSVVNTAGSLTGSAEQTLNATAHSAGAVGGLTSAGRLSSDSSGVFGLQGLSINSAASSATQGSMIVSSAKNVHLDSGTQMLLNVAGQAR